MFSKSLPRHDEALSSRDLAAHVKAEQTVRADAVRQLPKVDEEGPLDITRALSEVLGERAGLRHAEIMKEELEIGDLLAFLKNRASLYGNDVLEGKVTGKVVSVFQNLSGVIRETVVLAQRGEAEFKAFRERHGLTERSASYPLSKVKHFGGVAVLGLLEAAGNSVMYAAGNSWLQAVLTAVALTAANLGLATVVGLCLKFASLTAVDHE